MAVKHWGLPLVALLTMVAFWPWWEGGALATRWGAMAIGASLLLFGVKVRLTPIHWAGLTLLGWGVISLVWTPVEVAGAGELAKWVMMAAVFLVAAEVEDLRWTYLAIIAGVAISGAVATAQSLGYEGVPQLAPPAGLFVNRNYLAEAGTVALILTLGLMERSRFWLLLPTLALPLTACAALLPHSRGVIVALLLCGLWWLRQHSKRWFWLSICVAACLLVVPLPHVITDGSSLLERVGVWKATVEHLTWLGHGVGSYYAVYPTFVPHPILVAARPAHAHNELVNIASDLGVPGLVLLLGFGWLAFRNAGAMERCVLVALFGISLFSFPLHVPATGFIFAVVAGSAAARWRLLHGRELHGGTVEHHRQNVLWAKLRDRAARFAHGCHHLPV